MDYLCNAKERNVKLDGRELQEYVWIKPQDALNLDLEDFTRNFVAKYLEKKRSAQT
jgi:translation initiation factor IF-1